MIGKRMMLCLLLAVQMTAVCACRGEEAVAEVGDVPTHGGEVTTAAETNAVTTDAVTQTVTEPAELFAEPASEEVRQRFMASDDYAVINQTALAFFEAYRYADIAAANALLDSPDNPCLEHFPTVPVQAYLSEYYPFDVIRCITDNDGRVAKVYADIGWSAEEDPAMSFGIIWMHLTLECITRIDDAGNPYEVWCITAFENIK